MVKLTLFKNKFPNLQFPVFCYKTIMDNYLEF